MRLHLWFGMFFSIYVGINYYIGLRGRQLLVTQLNLFNVTVYWIIFVLLVCTSIFGAIGQRFLPDYLRGLFSRVGYYWMAALVYFLMVIVLIDLVRLCGHWSTLLRAVENKIAFTSALGLFIMLAVAGLLIYGTWQANNIKVTSYSIHIAKQAGSLKQLHIVMISDLHLNDIGPRRAQKIINIVNSLNPELVLIPGDVVPSENFAMVSSFRQIKNKYGIYASLGNHDYYGNLAYVTDWLHRAGITSLRDSYLKVAQSLYLVGREDKSYHALKGNGRQDLKDYLAGINRDLPIIMLDHQPVDLEEASNAGVDLQLSGHTHRGQFFPFNLITRKVFKTDYGYLKIGTLQLIVSSGAGTWGPPVRIGSTPEVVDIMVSFD